ncbi:MAG: class C beta-lactamase-related serine hydrolase, partial [Proteobacteria bacterium]
MRIIKKLFASLLLVILIAVAVLLITGNGYILRGVWVTYMHGHQTAYLDDYVHFDNRTIAKSNSPQPWLQSNDYNVVPATARLENLHKEIGSVAFLVIKNDSIFHESYYDGYKQDSHTNSFSMAKSIVTSALGKAIMDKKIQSLDTKVSTYFPEFSKGKAADLTVGDLASMSSGLDWDEKYYSPFSKTTQAYFDT